VLTEREAQVAQLVADGASARSIAGRLGIGVRTIETHIGHAYRKLGVGTREELRDVLIGR
jgi:DNA-binding CsgD family transcriptional regulator